MTGVLTLHTDLRAACRAKLLTVAGIPTDIAWEGESKDAGFGGPFVREAFRPIFSDKRAIGPTGTIQHRCALNLNLFYPAGQGTLAIEAAAGALLDAFRPGTSLAYGASSGMVQKAERMGLGQAPDYLDCPIIITITAYTAN